MKLLITLLAGLASCVPQCQDEPVVETGPPPIPTTYTPVSYPEDKPVPQPPAEYAINEGDPIPGLDPATRLTIIMVNDEGWADRCRNIYGGWPVIVDRTEPGEPSRLCRNARH